MNILERIVKEKRKELEKITERELHEVREKAFSSLPPKSFISAISSNGLSIIAEVKRASPSKGDINLNLDPQKLAKSYEAGGASAISVLTDEKFFKGSLKDLSIVANSVNLPVLRKDFIIHEYQIYTARIHGASSFLLIAGILEEEKLKRFISIGRNLGMEPLVEVHTEEEARKAISAGAFIVGINNRNLKNFSVSLETTLKLCDFLKSFNKLVVSESGISKDEDILMLKSAGVDGVLVGEALVKSGKPDEVIKRWLSL